MHDDNMHNIGLAQVNMRMHYTWIMLNLHKWWWEWRRIMKICIILELPKWMDALYKMTTKCVEFAKMMNMKKRLKMHVDEKGWFWVTSVLEFVPNAFDKVRFWFATWKSFSIYPECLLFNLSWMPFIGGWYLVLGSMSWLETFKKFWWVQTIMSQFSEKLKGKIYFISPKNFKLPIEILQRTTKTKLIDALLLKMKRRRLIFHRIYYHHINITYIILQNITTIRCLIFPNPTFNLQWHGWH